MTGPDAPVDERCGTCDRTLGWIDQARACPSGCLYCAECADDAGGSCPACGESLVRQRAKARALPG